MRRMIVPALLLLLPCTALAATPADAAFTLRCEREMKPQIEVNARDTPFSVHNTVSGQVLRIRLPDASVHAVAIGMTSSNILSEISFDAPAVPNGAALECVSPRIRVDLRNQPLDVYVAREFAANSCSYREIYAHEMRHVQLYREQLPLVKATVRDALMARYGDRPLYAARGQGEVLLQDDVDNWLRPLIKVELARVSRMQAELDSPEEIHRMSHACSGEVAAIVGTRY